MKTKILFMSVLVLSLCVGLNAQGWKYAGTVNLNLTQNVYSNNWQGTELGSITWVAGSNLSAEKQLSPLFYNVNSLKLAFGQSHQQKTKTDLLGNEELYWAHPEKSTDKIEAESLLKMTLQSYVNPFFGVRMESQFLDLSDPSLTRVVNPMKFTETAGITRNFIDRTGEKLSARLGAAFRQNLNRDVLVSLVPEERELQTTLDGGLEFVTEYRKTLSSNINYDTKLVVYQAVFNSRSDEYPNDEWKAADLNWEHNLGVKLYGAISLNLYMQLLYEKEQIDEMQFKETLGLGFSYNLF